MSEARVGHKEIENAIRPMFQRVQVAVGEVCLAHRQKRAPFPLAVPLA